MSIRVQSVVWAHAPYKDGTLLVLLSLADWANDDGSRVFPTMAALAQKTRKSMRGTRRILRQLEEDGVIRQIHRATGKPGLGTEYRIDVERLQKMTPIPDTKPQAPETADRNGPDTPPEDGEQRTECPGSTADTSCTEGGQYGHGRRTSVTETADKSDRYIDNRQGNHQEIPPDVAADHADGRQPLALEPYLQGIEKLFGWRLWDNWFGGADFYRESDSTLIAVDKAFNRNWIAGRFLPRLEQLFGSSICVLLKSELERAA